MTYTGIVKTPLFMIQKGLKTDVPNKTLNRVFVRSLFFLYIIAYVVRVYGCLMNVVWCVDRMWRGCLALLAVLTATLCCQISEFRCRNGRCVRLDQYCNTVDDCGDMSDEPRYCTGTLQVEVVVARVV